MTGTGQPAPPVAAQKPHTSTVHGVTLEDPYAWLRADNWQEVMRQPDALAGDIRAHLDAENAWCNAVMAPADALRETLFGEMKGRIKEDDMAVPNPDGPYDYGVRFVTGGQQPVFYRTGRDGGSGGDDDETILLDGNKEADGKAYFRLASATHSVDHSLLAWACDDKGSEFFTLRVRDIASGRELDDVITETGGGAVWSKDGRFIFYIKLDDNHRPGKLLRHELGTGVEKDVLVYEEKDPGFFMGVGKSQSGDYIIIDCHDHETSEVRLLAADQPTGEPVLVAGRETGLEYSVDEANGQLYILTNADDAEDFKIMTAPVSAPGRTGWRDLVAHEQGRLILSHTVYAGHMVRLERTGGLPQIIIHQLADASEHTIAFDEECYALGLSDGYEFDTTSIRFSYSSPTTPSQVYDYDMATRQRLLRKEQEVPSGHNAADYVTRRIMVRAPDGAQVPVSLLYHKDTALDGTAPCWLWGYGAYGLSFPAGFSTNRLTLVDRGFVFAIAHIRGGKDKGYHWYRQGRHLNKRNTFDDFIAVARHLGRERIVAPDRIVAEGQSAGGMLMGAIANMAPELFHAIVADVPFVDVLNTMLDASLPLTPPEWPEWGNPITSKTDFDYIASYSPYENISAQDYPHILAVAGLTDPRVTYWEPAKWVARLREKSTGERLLLLKTNMDSGHGGASGRFDQLKEVALVYAFGLALCGHVQLAGGPS